MSILLCVSIAWATMGILFMGLGLAVLLVAERASDASRAIIADDGIADLAARMASVDLAISERQPARNAQEFADDLNGLARLESMITSALHDANAKARCAVADRKEHTGAVIIRDPRLTRARCAQLQGHSDAVCRDQLSLGADVVRRASPSL